MTVTDLSGTSPNCGALVVSFSLAPDSQYLSTAGAVATVDFNSATSALGDWTLTVNVHHTGYVDASNPVGTLDHAFSTGDPCDDADALTIGTAYINGLAATYDLFSDFSSVTWDPNSVVTPANAAITDANCGALSVTLAYTSGPEPVYIAESATSFDLWGDVPSYAPQNLVLTFTAKHADYAVT